VGDRLKKQYGLILVIVPTLLLTGSANIGFGAWSAREWDSRQTFSDV
jgi:hypothetical protein